MPSQSLLHLHEIASFKRPDLELAVQNLARSAYLGDHAIAHVPGAKLCQPDFPVPVQEKV